MYLKEYCEIRKDGRTIVSKKNDSHVMDNFIESMATRGNTTFSFFVNREGVDDLIDTYGRQVSSSEVIESGNGNINWSFDFNVDDMLNMIMLYLDGFPQKERMAFLMQLQSMIIGDILTDGDEEEDISGMGDIDIV